MKIRYYLLAAGAMFLMASCSEDSLDEKSIRALYDQIVHAK